ncbi:MAG TPA: hypothetical protein VI874_05000, partial [Candidatus Norongarragalinales archaeon]|nr:hypothetical protein [Candidatus Norongarragalinales archaeon]
HPDEFNDRKKCQQILGEQLTSEMRKLGYFEETPDGSVILDVLKMKPEALKQFMKKAKDDHFDSERLPGNHAHFKSAKIKGRMDPDEIKRAVMTVGVQENDAETLAKHIVAHAQDFTHAAWVRKLRIIAHRKSN